MSYVWSLPRQRHPSDVPWLDSAFILNAFVEPLLISRRALSSNWYKYLLPILSPLSTFKYEAYLLERGKLICNVSGWGLVVAIDITEPH